MGRKKELKKNKEERENCLFQQFYLPRREGRNSVNIFPLRNLFSSY
jgi:hypothetical protein